MNGRRMFFALTTALIAALLLIACGQSSNRRLPSAAFHPAIISLSDALAELDAMQAPEGADPAVFAQLKDSLRTALFARGVDKLISRPPTGAANAVPDFAITDAGGGTADLTWHYYNLGDYNQDGTVGIADVTPLAMHFGEGWIAGEENTLPAVVDGSGDGTVNIADVTPIAMNFGVEAARYGVDSSDTQNGVYSLVQIVPLTDGLDENTARMHFLVNITPTSGLWYCVVPADGPGNPGVSSNQVQAGAAGTPVASIVPDVTSGTVPFTVNFDASGSTDDGTIVKFEWDWEGDGTYDLDSGAVATASYNYTTPGNYNATVRVTDNDSLQATASVAITASGAPKPPVASIVPSVDHGSPPLSVDLDASGSTDSDGTIVKYEWDFQGDGTFELDTGTTSSVNYIYADVGSYHPAVRVTDNDGLQGTASTPITVSFPSWAHTWGVSGNENACGVAEGPSGNIYVAGNSDSYKGGFWISTLISKYTPEGDPAWVRTWDGDEDDFARDIAVDNSDNIYVVGSTVNSGLSDYDAFLFKLNTDGVIQYQMHFGGGSGWEDARAVAVDLAGQAYVVGNTDAINGTYDMFIAKFNSIGAFMWLKDWAYTGTEYAANVVVDGTGNVFVVGSADSFGAGDTDAILLCFDTNGNPLWERSWAGAGSDYGLDVALDSSGNVYVLGETNSYGTGGCEAVLLKYDSFGTLAWQQTWGTPGNEYPSRIAIDGGTGDIYIAGYTDSLVTGIHNAFLVRYNSSGTLVNQMGWVHGSDYTNAYGLLFSSQNAPYIVGYSPDASVSWAAIGGLSGIGLGTPSVITGNLMSIITAWPLLALSNVVAEQTGTIDTGGGSSDQLIIKENPLFW
jgi:uncharacterized delta-60 repeat protein